MRRYLVVDDNHAFAENLAEIISDTGAEVDLTFGGMAALERVDRFHYDALLSDMRMSVMGGAELVHRIRGLDPGLPAIMITAYTNDEDLEAARREGLLAVLPKPVPVARMLELIQSARRDGLIALVEDDAALSDNLSEALRGHGFAAVTAGSILQTERLGDVRPFCAIVDLRLPGGPDGAALALLSEKFPGLPILVITALAEVPLPMKHEEIFFKPFDTARLIAAVERLYQARHG